MQLNFDPTWIVPLVAAAAAWGGSRQALNGTRERVKAIDEKLDKHITQVHTDIASRLAIVETKIDSRVNVRLDRLENMGDTNG